MKSTFVGLFLLFASIVCQAEQLLFHCSFPTQADGNSQKFVKQDFGFKILVESSETGVKASMIGEIATPLFARFGSFGQISLIEETGVGNLNITTILTTGEAVHSRHVQVSEQQSLFSQQYGKCLPKN